MLGLFLLTLKMLLKRCSAFVTTCVRRMSGAPRRFPVQGGPITLQQHWCSNIKLALMQFQGIVSLSGFHAINWSFLAFLVNTELSRSTGAQTSFDPELFAQERSRLLSVLPKTQAELPKRTQRDSYAEVVIPLESDVELQNQFVNVYQGIRTGRLLECLDVFSVYVCFKYAYNEKQNVPSPFSIVTALVDNLTLRPGAFLNPKKDILLTGFVSWVGRSSMEVTMSVLQDDTEKLRSNFVMVARDPLNRGSAVINAMSLENDDDRLYFEKGEANVLKRKASGDESLLKSPPNGEESKLIHEMFLRSDDFTADSAPPGANEKFMSEATYKDITLCHPNHRNRYNKIFGGFVMRLAYELGWASATSYCGTRMGATFIDDILFRRPVEVGSILHLTSVIGYTEGDSVLVRVRADVEDYKTGKKELTNTFYFTFKAMDGSTVPSVIPRSYKGYMIYLDARRHFLKNLASQ
ncbi:unnamed protein product [Notodromas monacha]|uniref:HotDog ACOT-type domain-containing protein n=1 Tax=Notodromas monacha TaxID=399045 RepID=A0A7R9BNY3_9CRUS|nr:unnamed protein product [Notodromas monacha]CAG0918136.1 unnamed protein product [Notodromas monacha]